MGLIILSLYLPPYTIVRRKRGYEGGGLPEEAQILL
jgi:hypothetical protein